MLSKNDPYYTYLNDPEVFSFRIGERLPMFCEEKYNDCFEIGATNCWERFFEFLPKAERYLNKYSEIVGENLE